MPTSPTSHSSFNGSSASLRPVFTSGRHETAETGSKTTSANTRVLEQDSFLAESDPDALSQPLMATLEDVDSQALDCSIPGIERINGNVESGTKHNSHEGNGVTQSQELFSPDTNLKDGLTEECRKEGLVDQLEGVAEEGQVISMDVMELEECEAVQSSLDSGKDPLDATVEDPTHNGGANDARTDSSNSSREFDISHRKQSTIREQRTVNSSEGETADVGEDSTEACSDPAGVKVVLEALRLLSDQVEDASIRYSVKDLGKILEASSSFNTTIISRLNSQLQ